MEKDHIDTFLKLCETGCNFTKTARLMNTSQPAISRKMSELQASLGKELPLFQSSGRGKKLTPVGEDLKTELRELREHWNSITPRLQEKAGKSVKTPVRVGSGATGAHYLMRDAISKFHRENPEVELSIKVQLFSETLAQLRSGDLDFGLRSCRRDEVPATMKFQPIQKAPYRLIVPKGSPIKKVRKAEDLSGQAFVGASGGTRGWNTLQGFFADRGVPISMAMTVGTWDLCKLYVESGLGIALVPEFCILPGDRRKLSVREAPEGFPVYEYGLIHRKEHYLPAPAKALMKLLASTPS